MKSLCRSSLFGLALVVLGALLSLSAVPAQAQTAVPARGTFEPTECWFDPPIPLLPTPEFECGYVTVPERHEAPDGPAIRLPVAVARATGPNPQPDPLFLAQGGPGGDAFEIFPVLLASSTILEDRDVVVFNQRGTRYAEPDLSCTESFDAAGDLLLMSPEESEGKSLELLRACYDRLQAQGIDLSAYNSVQNAADVDLIRQALGYDEYNYYGVSYGTLLGFHLLRDQPDHLRSAILDGVVPTNLNFIPKVTENTDRVFTAVIDACRDDPGCAADYPNLEGRFFSLVDRLNENPIEVKIKDPETGKTYKVPLDGDGLVDVFFQAFYLPDNYAYFPKLVASLEEGDYTFIEGIWPLFAFDRTISEGMYFSVICAEDADVDIAEANLEGVRPYFADGIEEELAYYADACAIWQVEQLPPSVDAPVTSDLPVLLLSGQYDPITPPSFADVAAAGLAQGINLVHPTGSHGVAFGDPCLDSILTQFLNDPQVAPDAACLDLIEPQEFAPVDALSLPFLGAVNQLDEGVAWQLGLASLFLLIVLSAFVVLPLTWLIRALRKKPDVHTAVVAQNDPRADRLKWLAGIVVLLFGFLAVVFVFGATYFALDSLFSGLASIFAVSGRAAPFFVIPLILVVLAIIMTVLAIISWVRGYWPTWARIYYSVVAISAVAYVIVLGVGGMLTVLL
jgi:pimeloyl-ACP methyl ester carboxylesterase